MQVEIGSTDTDSLVMSYSEVLSSIRGIINYV